MKPDKCLTSCLLHVCQPLSCAVVVLVVLCMRLILKEETVKGIVLGILT